MDYEYTTQELVDGLLEVVRAWEAGEVVDGPLDPQYKESADEWSQILIQAAHRLRESLE